MKELNRLLLYATIHWVQKNTNRKLSLTCLDYDPGRCYSFTYMVCSFIENYTITKIDIKNTELEKLLVDNVGPLPRY